LAAAHFESIEDLQDRPRRMPTTRSVLPEPEIETRLENWPGVYRDRQGGAVAFWGLRDRTMVKLGSFCKPVVEWVYGPGAAIDRVPVAR
jgi:hypothetical protein